MTPSPPPAATQGSAAAPPTAAPLAKVHVEIPTGPLTVEVEVVKSRGRVERGLMYRKFMAPDHGMLFLMEEAEVHHFWMKNTLIPLDILFIGSDFRVVGILHDMQPLDETSKGVGKPSLYVLEVNTGWAKQHGVGDGTLMRFEGVEEAAR